MNIAVMGKIRSGKSTVSDYISKKLNTPIYDFGDALKEVVGIMYPHTKEVKDRALLQTVGQHMRKIDEDVWVNALLDNMKNENRKHNIVTGLRQPNEYKALVERGFFIIKVVANEEDRIQRATNSGDKMTLDSLNHETESYIDGFGYDFLIENNGSLMELYSKVDSILRFLKSYNNLPTKNHPMGVKY
ncbi:MAG: AAA family ATPase [Bacilli bacterium]|uniref:deoxynucleotide monophosphate kinase family protein n=1 Tax=Clostridium sp. TaxID=1506 RepID=UPI002FC5EFE0